MSQDFIRTVLNGAIEALLAEGSIHKRLSDADPYVGRLEQHKTELPDGCFERLVGLVVDLAHSKYSETDDNCAKDHLSPEQEFALAEELLSLYVAATGGVLIF